MFNSKKQVSLLALALILIAGFSSGCGKEQVVQKNETNENNSQISQEPELTKFDYIKELFAQKYNKSLEEVELLVTFETDAHVKGSVSLGEGEENRGMFLAAKNDDVWQIVFDGNGSFACSLLDEYAFPSEMKEGCYVPAKVTTIVNQVTWLDYQNETLGYNLSYPSICSILGIDVDDQIDFICNWQGDGTWPRFRIAHHKTDFYQPELGTDVVEWVQKHPEFDLGSTIEIAGLKTVHFVQKKSAQTDGADYYYFIKEGQLYQIMILHIEGRQDKELYEKFLESFHFDE